MAGYTEPGNPNRALAADMPLREVFASRYLQGLFNLKPVPQTKDYTCGAAAVATVVRHLGLEASEGACAQALKTTPVEGTTAENMLRYFRSRELNARAYTKVPLEVIIDRCRVGDITLVDWNDYGGHWVVVAGVEPRMGAIVLADPARPRCCFGAYSFETFRKHWHCDAFGRGGRYYQLAVFVDKWKSREVNNASDRWKERHRRHEANVVIRDYNYQGNRGG